MKRPESHSSRLLSPLIGYAKRIPVEIRCILFLFISSRFILTLIGVFSRLYLQPRLDFSKVAHHAPTYSGTNTWLSIWGVWDTGWYLNIAQNWYNTKLSGHGGANYGFFPLYPFLMRVVGFVVGNNFTGGLIVSNLALLVAAFILYQLVSRQTDHRTSLRAILFMFLFPTAFIFSAAFSESVFVMCMLASFYFARSNRWLLAGLCGGLVALTRSVGVFIGIPLFLEYMIACNFRLRRIRPDILFLGLVPFGLVIFGWQCYLVTGDFLAFAHIQKTGWGHELANPFSVLWNSLNDGDMQHFCNGISSIAMILILTLGIRQIGPTFWLMSMILMFFPPLAGYVCMNSMLRYSLVVFPIYIILARIPEDSVWHWTTVVSLAMLQGFLMVFWTNSFDLII